MYDTLLIYLLVFRVNGFGWDGASITEPASTTANTPEPTSPPELIRRDSWSAMYCGFINGSTGMAATCHTSSSCVWNTDIYRVGCCSGGACLFYTTCRDTLAPTTVADDSLAYTCLGTSTCFENAYPSNYHQVGCRATTFGTGSGVVKLTWDGQPENAPTIQQTFLGSKELASESTIEVSTTVTTVQTITVVSNQPASTYPTTQATSSGSSTGVIVGAAIGGSLILVLGIIVTVFLYLHQRNKNTQTATTTQPPVPEAPPSNGVRQSLTSYFTKDTSPPYTVQPEMQPTMQIAEMDQGQTYRPVVSPEPRPATMSWQPPQSPVPTMRSPNLYANEMDGESQVGYDQGIGSPDRSLSPGPDQAA